MRPEHAPGYFASSTQLQQRNPYSKPNIKNDTIIIKEYALLKSSVPAKFGSVFITAKHTIIPINKTIINSNIFDGHYVVLLPYLLAFNEKIPHINFR